MEKLIKGLHKFQTEVFPIQKDFFEDLAKGQSPETLFITCSDSRINPNLVTSAAPGDLFILRNAGNIIPPFDNDGGEIATIEFAVCKLGVKHIIICGHFHCGAIEAAFELEKLSSTPHLYAWIHENVSPTLKFVRDNYQDLTSTELLNVITQEHVLQQIEHLKMYEFIAEAIADQKIILHAWIYRVEDGNIFSYNQQTEQFDKLKHIEE